MKQFSQFSLRQKLLLPTVIIMVFCIACLSFTLVSVQKNQLNRLEKSVKNGLTRSNNVADETYAELGKEVSHDLQLMSNALSASIEQTCRESLEEEKLRLEAELNSALRQSAESIANLLAQVAPPAILSNNFLDLIGYAKSATQNSDIIYAVFMRSDGEPMTRYLDRKSSQIKKYLKLGEEKNKVLRVIAASRKDDGVMLMEKSIVLEEKVLGSILICVDKTSSKQKVAALADRFNQLILNNTQTARSVVDEESAKLSISMSQMLKNVAIQSRAEAGKIEQIIIDISNAMRSKIQFIVLTAGGMSILFLLLILYIFLTRVTKSFGLIASDLDHRFKNITSASRQIASISQKLAKGSAEQASSIEETSGALEEMTSMTKRNAENASEANRLMEETRQVVSAADASMTQLTNSMEEIAVASAKTSKINKTIDEIAFQTNLLALNAAVEAARAGEAGAGFAVVADEVRSLSIRAAEAAKNTSGLIEETVRKVSAGKNLVTEANDAFGQVTDSSTQIGAIVAEIAAASNEQAQGIDQINLAVNDMDKVVQGNARGAEEASSASEEMRSESKDIKSIIDALVVMISGRLKPKSEKMATPKPDMESQVPQRKAPQLIRLEPKNRKKTESPETAAKQLLPFDDDDFNNF